MLQFHDATIGSGKHNVCMSFSDFSFWCYECDSYVISEELAELCSLFQNEKFKETDTMREIKEEELFKSTEEKHGLL